MASENSVGFAGTWMFRLKFGCSGGTWPLGVDVALPGSSNSPSHPKLDMNSGHPSY